ncbi:MAG TPA: cobalamin-dependent protein [Polyangia bacterium]|jgi:methanogenic corrinoid protein MtbC1|nr:cobalamin-dependent protein [Polyangia bacterium]
MSPPAALIDRFVTAQLAGNRREAIRLVTDGLGEGGAQRLSFEELYLEVIQAAQYRIGELWLANEVTIAQEHLATAIAQLALSHLYPRLPRAARLGKRVVLACVEGELHERGPRIMSDFLEMGGFDVDYLGANVPTESLVKMVTGRPPDLLALSATLSFHLPALRQAVSEVRKAMGRRVPIAVGGHAFSGSPDVPRALDVDIYARDAKEMLDAVRRLLAP